MPKYRKKPVVVDAILWNGDNLREVINLIGLHPSAHKWTWEEYEEVVREQGLKIFMHSGSLMAEVGDYIVLDEHGDTYPCNPVVFYKFYEPIESEE